MKKIIIISAAAALLLGGGALGYVQLTRKDANNGQTQTSSLTNAQEQGQPTRTAELKGYVKSIEGNQVIIANEISDEPELSDEEKAARKEERQALSQEERQVLRDEELAGVKTENVSVTIPVGVPVMKTSGDASGELADSQLAEIKEGVYLSIWVKNYAQSSQSVEFVKLRGTSS